MAHVVSLIEMEVTNLTATNSHSHNGPRDSRAECRPAPDKGESVLILYGTTTGNAELLADKLAALLRQAGIAAQVRDMGNCQPRILTEASCVLMVVSTYGDGEPPENAAFFYEALLRVKRLDLRGVNFSVLALGNTTFDNFCKCGRDIDAALERHGATRIYPRVDCDVDYDTLARRWFSGVLASLLEGKRNALFA
jgi:sulfite reductase (NADPH) flavoprotein alpha-component